MTWKSKADRSRHELFAQQRAVGPNIVEQIVYLNFRNRTNPVLSEFPSLYEYAKRLFGGCLARVTLGELKAGLRTNRKQQKCTAIEHLKISSIL